jgi:protease-4
MADETVPRKSRWRRRFVIALLLLLPPVALLLLVTRKPTIEPGTVLVVHLEGQLPETAADNPLERLGRSLGGAEGPASLHDLRRALTRAKTDSRIGGVLLELHPVQMGWAAVDEVRELLAEVRAAGKPVQALLAGDFIEEREYTLALPAARILCNPEAGVMLNGLLAEVTFYRGLLDNLRIEPQVLQFKEYKSAGEPLVNREMSPAMRESLTAILSGIHDRFLSRVAAERKIDPAELRRLVDRGLLTATDAVKARLLDGVGYRDEVLEALQPGASEGKERKDGKRRTASVGRYLKALPDEPHMAEVALIYAVGPITSGGGGGSFPGSGGEVIQGEKTAKAIREAATEEGIKAIVLRVDSPGGSAVGSDFVWREIDRARKKKPVVISMSNVAASGGYWISMGADAIVAEPSTITGSIGVVSIHVNALPLLRWAGMSVDTIKLGQHADLMSMLRSWGPEDQARMTDWMKKVYEDFVSKVAKGRGLQEADVEAMARGRVWSGERARELKLVDALGGLREALRLARERAKLPPKPDDEPVVFPRERGLMKLLGQGGQVLQQARQPKDLEGMVTERLRALQAMGLGRPALLAPSIDIH